jgi:hypothetical protein
MELLTIKLSPADLELLASLASDQLFRQEFIDHRLPGCKTDPADIQRGKSLVNRLQAILNPAAAAKKAAHAKGLHAV